MGAHGSFRVGTIRKGIDVIACTGLTCDKCRIFSATKVLQGELRWPEFKLNQLGCVTTIVLTTEVTMTAVVITHVVVCGLVANRVVVITITVFVCPVITLPKLDFMVIAN
jgi:hypothetical protein